MDLGNLGGAIPLFERAKHIEAEAARLRHSAPSPLPIEEEVLIAQKRYNEAILLLEDGPQNGFPNQAWLAVLYKRVGNEHRARLAFRKAFYRDGIRDLHPGLERFLSLNGETDKTRQAVALMYLGTQINPDERSRVDAEVKLLEEADRLVPKNAFIAFRIGEAYFHAERYEDALPYLQAAREGLKPYLERYGCDAMFFACSRYIPTKKHGR